MVNMQYNHFITVAGDHTPFAYDLVTDATIDNRPFLQLIQQTLTSCLPAVPVSQYTFTIDSPTLAGVVNYNPHFRQLAFTDTWADFLARVAAWQQLPPFVCPDTPLEAQVLRSELTAGTLPSAVPAVSSGISLCVQHDGSAAYTGA